MKCITSCRLLFSLILPLLYFHTQSLSNPARYLSRTQRAAQQQARQANVYSVDELCVVLQIDSSLNIAVLCNFTENKLSNVSVEESGKSVIIWWCRDNKLSGVLSVPLCTICRGILTRNLAFFGDNDLIVVDVLGRNQRPQLIHQIAVDEVAVRTSNDVDGNAGVESLGAGGLTVCQSQCAIKYSARHALVSAGRSPTVHTRHSWSPNHPHTHKHTNCRRQRPFADRRRYNQACREYEISHPCRYPQTPILCTRTRWISTKHDRDNDIHRQIPAPRRHSPPETVAKWVWDTATALILIKMILVNKCRARTTDRETDRETK